MTSPHREFIAREFYMQQKKSDSDALKDIDKIKCIVKKNEILCKKVKQQHEHLQRLENSSPKCKFSRNQYGEEVPVCQTSGSYQENIDSLEAEIKNLRSQPKNGDSETEIIRKEVQVMKLYCAKLSTVNDENRLLKKELKMANRQVECANKLLQNIGIDNLDDSKQIDGILNKLEEWKNAVKERDLLKLKTHELECELLKYKDLPEDIEDIKKKTALLDDVTQDRDRLKKIAEERQGTASNQVVLDSGIWRSKAKDLEKQIKLSKINQEKLENDKKYLEENLSTLQQEFKQFKKADNELSNLKTQNESLIRENNTLKELCKDTDWIKKEKLKIEDSLHEMSNFKMEYVDMCSRMKCLNMVKSERDIYKRKMEDMVYLEMECNKLRLEMEKAKRVIKERDDLKKKLKTMEIIVRKQEMDIESYTKSIESLSEAMEREELAKSSIFSLKSQLSSKSEILQQNDQRIVELQLNLDQILSKYDLEKNVFETEKTRFKKEYQNMENKMLMYKENNVILKQDLDGLVKLCQELTKSSCLKHEKICSKISKEQNHLIELNENLKKQVFVAVNHCHTVSQDVVRWQDIINRKFNSKYLCMEASKTNAKCQNLRQEVLKMQTIVMDVVDFTKKSNLFQHPKKIEQINRFSAGDTNKDIIINDQDEIISTLKSTLDNQEIIIKGLSKALLDTEFVGCTNPKCKFKSEEFKQLYKNTAFDGDNSCPCDEINQDQKTEGKERSCFCNCECGKGCKCNFCDDYENCPKVKELLEKLNKNKCGANASVNNTSRQQSRVKIMEVADKEMNTDCKKRKDTSQNNSLTCICCECTGEINQDPDFICECCICGGEEDTKEECECQNQHTHEEDSPTCTCEECTNRACTCDLCERETIKEDVSCQCNFGVDKGSQKSTKKLRKHNDSGDSCICSEDEAKATNVCLCINRKIYDCKKIEEMEKELKTLKEDKNKGKEEEAED